MDEGDQKRLDYLSRLKVYRDKTGEIKVVSPGEKETPEGEYLGTFAEIEESRQISLESKIRLQSFESYLEFWDLFYHDTYKEWNGL